MINPGQEWANKQIDSIETIFKMPFIIFDMATEIEKFKMLTELTIADAAKVIKSYYDLYDFGYLKDK